MADIHIHIHNDYAPTKPAQVSKEVGLEDETDGEKEHRLARIFGDGGTLTPEELMFLKGRGALRY